MLLDWWGLGRRMSGGMGAGRDAASTGQGAPEKGDLYSEEVKALFTRFQSRF